MLNPFVLLITQEERTKFRRVLNFDFLCDLIIWNFRFSGKQKVVGGLDAKKFQMKVVAVSTKCISIKLAESPTTPAFRLGWPSTTVVLAILLFSFFKSSKPT
ncbi:hypothetical protein L596_022461 [Steinernema carpocapsae]|uniref:Uncharacterized protein n=1 Tax=Steinernema carpocapsae TaxID=34508 RepID=A0A4U5MLV7_STECR|nr:hypothetical protein L596_022461 [Steinernema carpocapsae]